MSDKINLRILDIGIEVQFSANNCLPINRTLERFVCKKNDCLDPIRIIFVENPIVFGTEQEFLKQTGLGHNSLSLHQTVGGAIMKFSSGLICADSKFIKVLVWSPYEHEISVQRDGFPNFNGDPVLRIVLWGHASIRGFCYVHGALNVLDGKYILFMGDSGVGKTTISNLVCDYGGTCLTEEDPFINWENDKPYVYGTPWPGVKGPEVKMSGKLHAIFFLRHARKNRINLLNRKITGRKLLHNTRIFKWLPEVVPNAIQRIDKFANFVPAYDFGFFPDRRAIDFIRSVL